MRHLALYIIGFIFLEAISIAMLSSTIGWVWTLIVIVVFFLIGSFMFKKQGANLQKMLDSLQNDELGQTWYEKVGPIRYSLAALLFISPGIFSDIIGGVLLLPVAKNQGQIHTKPRNPFSKTKPYQHNQPEENIIEGEFREVTKEKKEE
ncbi:MAG: FxsA family protein [Neisseriaceae bacterium]|nr:FxsA family protein [Neisseriaceae bacterium]